MSQGCSENCSELFLLVAISIHLFQIALRCFMFVLDCVWSCWVVFVYCALCLVLLGCVMLC